MDFLDIQQHHFLMVSSGCSAAALPVKMISSKYYGKCW